MIETLFIFGAGMVVGATFYIGVRGFIRKISGGRFFGKAPAPDGQAQQ